MAEMKSLNGNEIIDAKARKRLDDLEKNGGNSESENLRILIAKVNGAQATSSHTAQEIYEADVAERVIEASMDGYRYEYLGAAHFADDGVCDEVTFYRTMVETDGRAFTETVKIFDDKTATVETVKAPEIDAYTKEEVNQMVSSIPKFKVEVVTVHPTITEASTTTVYLVPSGNENQNLYTEWICVEKDGARTWELLGSQHLDLTGYVTIEALNAAVEEALKEAKESGDFKGDPGTSVTVSSVSESTASGGENVVTFSDGKTLTVKNGVNGKDGADGKDGAVGATGATGAQGPKGDPYTLTETDKSLIVAQVIESLGGNPIFGYVDEDTNTVVLENAPDGEYTIAYINDNGAIIPIGEMVKDTNVYYSITNNLTNCTNSNSAKSVVAGGSYAATISGNSGYALDSVSVTMGGSSVSVSGGVISIANVTGDIVITAVASEVVAPGPGYTNLAKPNDTYWEEDCRLSISSGGTSALAGHHTTNFIPVKIDDVLRVKGMKLTSDGGGVSTDCKIVTYAKKDDISSKINGMYGANSMGAREAYAHKVTVNGDVSEYKLFYDNNGTQAGTEEMNYIRIDGTLLGGYTKNDVVITVNEPIS